MGQPKVRFIEPGRRIQSMYSHYLKRWPLLGPVVLATILDERGYDAKIYNENLSGKVFDASEKTKDLADADFVGISIMTATANRGYEIARKVREINSSAKIVFGGVHATFCPEEALSHGDYVVKGEAEKIIEDLVNGKIEPGIIQGIPVNDLDTLPLPNYDLIDEYTKLWELDGGQPFYRAPLLTSRGCPYNCTYCSVSPMFGRKFRFRSADKVISDVQSLYERGYRGVFFYDDNLTANRERIKKILDGIRELDILWNAQARLDFAWIDPRQRSNCDTQLLDLMKDSGADVLYIGYETIEDQTAGEWNKGYVGKGSLLSRTAQDTSLLHSAGLWIHGMFVAGPQHNEKTFDDIVNFARKSKIETIQISALTPFPGTQLFKAEKDKLLFTNFPDDWDVYDGLHSVYNHCQLGVQRFQRKLIEAHKAFYRGSWMSLSRIAKLFRGPGATTRKLKNFIKWAQLPSNIFSSWDRETSEFLEEVARRNR